MPRADGPTKSPALAENTLVQHRLGMHPRWTHHLRLRAVLEVYFHQADIKLDIDSSTASEAQQSAVDTMNMLPRSAPRHHSEEPSPVRQFARCQREARPACDHKVLVLCGRASVAASSRTYASLPFVASARRSSADLRGRLASPRAWPRSWPRHSHSDSGAGGRTVLGLCVVVDAVGLVTRLLSGGRSLAPALNSRFRGPTGCRRGTARSSKPPTSGRPRGRLEAPWRNRR